MWIMERNSTFARNDEDSAMAYVNYGSVEKRIEAHDQLIEHVRNELLGYVNEIHKGYFNAYCIKRLADIMDELIYNPMMDSAEVDGLRFSLREVKTS